MSKFTKESLNFTDDEVLALYASSLSSKLEDEYQQAYETALKKIEDKKFVAEQVIPFLEILYGELIDDNCDWLASLIREV